MTRMLAQSFEHVIATDVSAEMLDYGRARIASEKVSWQLSDGDKIPAADSSVDAVFSCHVFQHFSSNAAQLSVFGEIFRVLKPSGTFFVHMPIHSFPELSSGYSRLARAGYAGFLQLSNARAVMRRMMIRLGINRPYMHGVSYEQSRLFGDLSRIGFQDISISSIVVRTSSAIHSCIAGRKPLT